MKSILLVLICEMSTVGISFFVRVFHIYLMFATQQLPRDLLLFVDSFHFYIVQFVPSLMFHYSQWSQQCQLSIQLQRTLLAHPFWTASEINLANIVIKLLPTFVDVNRACSAVVFTVIVLIANEVLTDIVCFDCCTRGLLFAAPDEKWSLTAANNTNEQTTRPQRTVSRR